MINTYGIFIFNSSEKLLICRPYGVKTKIGFTVPKGKAEIGETPIQATIRECFEETGFDVKKYKKSIIYIGSKTYKTKKKRFHGFILNLDEDIPIDKFFCDCKITGKTVPEIDKYEWVTVEEAISRIHEAQSKLLKEYIESDGG